MGRNRLDLVAVAGEKRGCLRRRRPGKRGEGFAGKVNVGTTRKREMHLNCGARGNISAAWGQGGKPFIGGSSNVKRSRAKTEEPTCGKTKKKGTLSKRFTLGGEREVTGQKSQGMQLSFLTAGEVVERKPIHRRRPSSLISFPALGAT